MKILIDDGLQLGVGTGIGSYARYLAEHLETLPDIEVVREDFAAKGPRKRARLAYLSYLASPRYRKGLREFDVVHYANYAMPARMPKGVLSVVTVHDLTAFLHPETLPRLYAAYNRFMVKRAVKRADVILTVSESVKKEITARFPAAAAKTKAVYPGHYHRVSDAAVAESYESPQLQGLQAKKFFLFVGTVEKRKNLGVLIEAYKRLCADLPVGEEYALVIAGRDGFGAETYHDMAKSEPVLGDIRFAGYVSAADRTKLYSEAAAFVFPSIYEGFGSPQTECMSFGLPLLVSDIPTNREISHTYGRFFAPNDPQALARELRRITEGDWDEAAAQREAAAVLSRLTWQESAEKTLLVYRNALKIQPR